MQPDNHTNLPQPTPPSQQQPSYPGGPGGQYQPPEYPSASQMRNDHTKTYLIGLIVMSVLFVGTAIFAVWAFMERQEYKHETDAIVAREVEAAVAQNTDELEAEFIEREKEPLTSYSGPSAYGGIRIAYPKTWSAYVLEHGQGSTPLEGYMHPGFVPDETGDTRLAVTFQVSTRSYQDSVRRFERAAERGEVTINPIEAANVDGVTGTRIDGEITKDTQGSVVLFEIRDKTLMLTTRSPDYMDDFDNIILKNLTFNP